MFPMVNVLNRRFGINEYGELEVMSPLDAYTIHDRVFGFGS